MSLLSLLIVSLFIFAKCDLFYKLNQSQPTSDLCINDACIGNDMKICHYLTLNYQNIASLIYFTRNYSSATCICCLNATLERSYIKRLVAIANFTISQGTFLPPIGYRCSTDIHCLSYDARLCTISSKISDIFQLLQLPNQYQQCKCCIRTNASGIDIEDIINESKDMAKR